MKGKSVAGLVAGLLLAGAAGVVLGQRRRRRVSVPAKPEQSAESEETPEHAALREILERSVAYNDALYERVCSLENINEAEKRTAAVEQLVQANQDARREIDAMRAALQTRLSELGYGFSGIDGFAELISEFRLKTLEQQERHMQVYERVRLLPYVPDSPELHAYLKLGYSDDEQKHADTDIRIRRATEEQRELMLRVGRALTRVKDAETASAVQAELLSGNKRYQELTERIRLYRYDDPDGASGAVEQMRSMYSALTPPLRTQAESLLQVGCYGDARLQKILERLLFVHVRN